MVIPEALRPYMGIDRIPAPKMTIYEGWPLNGAIARLHSNPLIVMYLPTGRRDAHLSHCLNGLATR